MEEKLQQLQLTTSTTQQTARPPLERKKKRIIEHEKWLSIETSENMDCGNKRVVWIFCSFHHSMTRGQNVVVMSLLFFFFVGTYTHFHELLWIPSIFCMQIKHAFQLQNQCKKKNAGKIEKRKSQKEQKKTLSVLLNFSIGSSTFSI